MLIYQSFNDSEEKPIKAEDALTELIDNNKALLENKMIISEFIFYK